MTRKKILIFKDDLLYANGGVADIVRNFTQFDQTKFDIYVAVWNGIPNIASKTLQNAGIKVIFDPNVIYDPINNLINNRLTFFTQNRLAENIYDANLLSVVSPSILEISKWLEQLLVDIQPDFIHIFDQFSEIIYGLTLINNPSSRNIKFYSSRIGENALIKMDLFDYLKLSLYFVHPFITRHIVNSDFVAYQLQETEGVILEKIVKIYNGIDFDVFTPTSHTLKAHDSIFTIAMVGELNFAKGYFDLFTALDHLKNSGVTNWKLLFIGKDIFQIIDKFNEYINKFSLNNFVTYLGQINNVQDFLNTAQIFVLPSHSESLPNSIIEAMGCQLPVIATNVGGIPELVDDGVTGLLVPPQRPDLLAEAIKKLIQNPEMARLMGEKGRIRAIEKFSLDRSAREFQALYTSDESNT